MDKTTALLIRHGETAQNVGRVFRGTADVPLNDTGRAQAERVAEILGADPIAAVYSSPLVRALDTAAPLAARLGLDVVSDPAFLDIDYGAWTGRQADDVEREDPDLSRLWLDAPERVTFPEGGSLARVRDRAWPCLVELAAAHAGGTFAVVTHRVVLKVLLAEAAGAGLEAFWQIRVDTASVSEVQFGPDGPVLARTNTPSAPGTTDVDF